MQGTPLYPPVPSRSKDRWTAWGGPDAGRKWQNPTLIRMRIGERPCRFVKPDLMASCAAFKQPTKDALFVQSKIGEIFRRGASTNSATAISCADGWHRIDALDLWQTQNQKIRTLGPVGDRIQNIGQRGATAGNTSTPRPRSANDTGGNPHLGRDDLMTPAAALPAFPLCERSTTSNTRPLAPQDREPCNATLLCEGTGAAGLCDRADEHILHGIEAPNLSNAPKYPVRTHRRHRGPRTALDIILANPPFGTIKNKQAATQNFPVQILRECL